MLMAVDELAYSFIRYLFHVNFNCNNNNNEFVYKYYNYGVKIKHFRVNVPFYW